MATKSDPYRTGLEKMALGLGMMVIGATFNLIAAWFVMLGLGAAHSIWPKVPAAGYWTTYLIVVGTAALAGSIHGGQRVKWQD